MSKPGLLVHTDGTPMRPRGIPLIGLYESSRYAKWPEGNGMRQVRLELPSFASAEHPESRTIWCPECGEGALTPPGCWTRCERCNTEHFVDA